MHTFFRLKNEVLSSLGIIIIIVANSVRAHSDGSSPARQVSKNVVPCFIVAQFKATRCCFVEIAYLACLPTYLPDFSLK